MEVEKTEKKVNYLTFRELVFLIERINFFKEPNRKIRTDLDNIEELLKSSIKSGKLLEDESEVEDSLVKIFTDEEFDAITSGVSFNRGERKTLETLLIK